jgi:hypothetical protein
MTNNSLTIEPGLISRVQVKETIIVLIVSIVIPFLIHLLPTYKGTPAGAILLAMFFAPFYAIRYFKFHVGVIAAIFSPMLNHLITGQPIAGLVPLLTLQLVLFVFLSKALYKITALKYFNASFSYVATIFISLIILLIAPALKPGISMGRYFESAFVIGFPGIFLLIFVNALLIKFDKK